MKLLNKNDGVIPVNDAPCCKCKNWILIFAIIIVIINMTIVWIDAQRNSYIPCVENCGETFRVLKYVQDFRIYGAKYGFIEDLSDERDANRVPLLYTHNPNLPGILFATLEATGFHALKEKLFLILLVHGLGLLYAFLSVRYLTGSSWIALVFTGLFATNYELVFGFALSPLRAWHWLAIFGLLYHVGHAVRALRPRAGISHIFASALLATIAMGIGYEFFTICLLISALNALVFMPAERKRAAKFLIIVLLVAAFATPLALRQAQIIFVMGLDYWRVDLYYSLLTKVTFLNNLISAPPISQIEQYYREQGVYRPLTVSRTAAEILSFFKELLHFVLLPLFGVVTLFIFAAVTMVAGAVSVRERLFGTMGTLANYLGDKNVLAPLRLVTVLAAGSVLGLAVFPDHNLVIFIKHKVPLIAAPIMLTKAVIVVWLASILRMRAIKTLVWVGPFTSVLALLILVDNAVIELNNVAAKSPYNFTWIDELQRRPDAKYAVSWDPTAASVFVNTKTVSMSRRDEVWLLDHLRLQSGYQRQYPPTLRPEQLSVLPDYWLYFPTDNMSPFDSFAPECRLDYLSELFLSILMPANPLIETRSNWVRPSSTPPGGYVIFGGKVNGLPFRGPHELRLVTRDNLVGEVFTNCHKQTFQGWVTSRAGQSDGEYSIAVGAMDATFSELKTQLNYRIARGTPAQDLEQISLILQSPMITAEDLVKRNPHIPVAARGPGWILFDLRKFK